MFLTNELDRALIPDCLKNNLENYWYNVQLVTNEPWYLVQVWHSIVEAGETTAVGSKSTVKVNPTPAEDDESADEPPMNYILFCANIGAVSKLHEVRKGIRTNITAVFIGTPGYVNGSGGWRMDRLASVWSASELSGDSIPVEIYETAEGVRYSNTRINLPLAELDVASMTPLFP